MSRKPRIHYQGALYHVILRGNAQDDVFYDDVDRTRFCLLMQEGTERFGYRVHAFCLLDDHIHIAIQVGERPLSRIMQNLTFRYTQWFNRRHQRVGHLFQGRYKTNLVDVDSYLLQLVSYIHLNPVRAGIMKRPESYRWSSHRFYRGDDTLPWLTEGLVLARFADREGEARERFHRFVLGGLDSDAAKSEFSPAQSDGRLIGNESFIERVQEAEDGMKGTRITLDGIIDGVCKAYGIAQDELLAPGRGRLASEARSVIGLIVQEHPEITIAEAAKVFQRDSSTLSAGAARLRNRMNRDRTLHDRINDVKSKSQFAVSNA